MRKHIVSTDNNEAVAILVAGKSRRLRRALVPLATLAAAGALTVGSGANFSSNTANVAGVYATGTLTQSNSKANAAIFNVVNLKPGDTVNGAVTITNTGSLPAVFSVTETATNGFADKSNLVMTVTQGGTTVYSGQFGSLGTKALGTFAAGEARTYNFSTQLKATAGNDEQGKTANAAYSWDAAQTDPVTVNQPEGAPANQVIANS